MNSLASAPPSDYAAYTTGNYGPADAYELAEIERARDCDNADDAVRMDAADAATSLLPLFPTGTTYAAERTVMVTAHGTKVKHTLYFWCGNEAVGYGSGETWSDAVDSVMAARAGQEAA